MSVAPTIRGTAALTYRDALASEPRFGLAEIRAILSGTRNREYLATRSGPAVREYLAWKRLGRRAAATLDTYERDLARLCLLLPDRAVDEFQVADLMLVLELVPEGSWRRFRSSWSGFFKWAVFFGHRPDNPCDRLPPMRPEPPPVYPIFTEAERQAMVNTAAHTPLAVFDRARMLLVHDTGARKGELRGMRVEDVDLATRTVLLHGKGSKERIVPVRGDVVHAIDLMLMTDVPRAGRPLKAREYVWFPVKRSGTHVLACYPNRPMSQRGMHEWWSRIAKGALGDDYRKLHMSRHTYATDLVDADVNLYDVKDLLGHASTRTTEIYVHSSRRRLERAAERLARLRRGEEDTGE